MLPGLMAGTDKAARPAGSSGCAGAAAAVTAAAAGGGGPAVPLLVVVVVVLVVTCCLAFLPLVLDLAVPFLDKAAGSEVTEVAAAGVVPGVSAAGATVAGGKSGWLKLSVPGGASDEAIEAGRNTASPGR